MFKRKKKIDAEKLIDIILHPSLNSNRNSLMKVADALPIYIKYIEAKIEECKVKDYISIKPIKKNVFEKEIRYEVYYEYKVTISNLIINMKEDINIVFKLVNHSRYPLSDYNPAIDTPLVGLLFEFKGNHFKCRGGEDSFSISINSGHHIGLSFIRNDFRCSHLNIFVASWVEMLMNFQGNFSKNINILVNELQVNNDNSAKNPIEQSGELDRQCAVRISGNKFKVLSILGEACFYFSGKNIIQLLRKADSSFLDNLAISDFPKVYWGAYQKLKEGGEHALSHKKIFTVLKQRAVANNDTAQEIILQREIARCDHAIAKSEGWRAWQDRTIFLFSKWISNYGTSWLMPLGWLAVLNLIIAVSAQYSIPGHELKTWAILSYIFSGTDFNAICTNAVSNMLDIWAILSDSQTLVIFLKLLNPTSYLPGLAEFKYADPDGWKLLSLFISQKVILAFTLYEMIKIFRRFGRR